MYIIMYIKIQLVPRSKHTSSLL